MPGITRIEIDSDWEDWRVILQREHAPLADELYREIFNGMGMPLADDGESIMVTKQEAMARYDIAEGIDVILTTRAGTRITLQEKFLTWWQSTATFEEKKTSGAPGFWYYASPQYYFIGYTRKYWDRENWRLLPDPIIDFQDWILIDYPAIKRAHETSELPWEFNKNSADGRRATFRYLDFDDVPGGCVIRRYEPFNPQPSLFGDQPSAYALGFRLKDARIERDRQAHLRLERGIREVERYNLCPVCRERESGIGDTCGDIDCIKAWLQERY